MPPFRLVDFLLRIRSRLSRPGSPRVQRLMLVLAVAVFLTGAIFAAGRLDLDLANIGWGWIALVMVVGVPLSAVANAAEYAICSTLLLGGYRVGEAFRISVLGTAANLLPIPGAALVRIQALVRGGTSYRLAVGAVTILALFWIGVSSLIAGGVLALFGEAWVFVFIVVGVITLAGGWFPLRRLAGNLRLAVRLGAVALIVEVGLVLTTALRLGFVLSALHVDGPVGQPLVLALSGSLAAAAGVFPGGLGLREILAALLAPLVGLAPSTGFVVSAVNQVVGLFAYSPLTAFLAVSKKQTAPWLGSNPEDNSPEATSPPSSDR
jgi:hypothetical protein